jgi:acid phosphatase type 7
MKFFLVMTWILISSSITLANTELFKIEPYTIRADNGDIHLKFQLNKPAKVNIIAYRENNENQTTFNQEMDLKEEKLVSVRLGEQNCDNTLGYKISFVEKSRKINVLNRQVPSFKCEWNDEFIFGFISDTQQGTEKHKSVAKVIVEHLKNTKLNFLLHTGDLVHHGGLNDEWLNYFSVAQSYLKGTPIIAAVGNHEYYDTEENSFVPSSFMNYMRWEGSQEIGYLTTIFPHFQLVIINSNFEEIKKGYSKQIKWLENTLSEAQEKGRPVIVAMHHPPFASSIMNVTPEINTLQEEFVPLFEKYGVKMVLNGHTHMYERSFKDGVHYVIAGPAGGARAMPLGVNPYQVYSHFLAMTFSTITVNHQSIELKTWDEENELIDSVSIPLK